MDAARRLVLWWRCAFEDCERVLGFPVFRNNLASVPEAAEVHAFTCRVARQTGPHHVSVRSRSDPLLFF